VSLVLRGGRVIDGGSSDPGKIQDLFIRDGVIAAEPGPNARVVDCAGKIVAPGFVDLHVHLREPGHEYKEDIASGTRAAAAGGFTSVCCMANTNPVNDCRAVTDLIVRRAREAGNARVFPVGAVTRGLKGETLAEMGEMKDAGIVAVSDDGMPVMNADVMRRALEYARTFGLPLIQHAQDLSLSAGGVMNEGPAATRAGLRGQPAAAESVMVARDLELVALTGARYHVAHISTKAAVEMVRQGKKSRLPVSCEVTPHHLTLTDVACCGYDTATKVNPPLRSQADIDALEEGLADGTIDCIATDHAPHAAQEKELEFDHAAFGMIGLETAWPLMLRLVEKKKLTLAQLIGKFTAGAKLFGLAGGTLQRGAAADVVVLDVESAYRYDAARGKSKSRNSPFHGWELRGRVHMTLLGGKVVHE
jgi:dihydroorotase